MTTETEKSPREIAEEVAKRITDNPCAHPSCCPHTAKAADAIEKALRDRDERAAKMADAVEDEWLENARNAARADDLVGGLAQSTYTSYAEVAGKIASAIRRPSK